QRQRVGQLGRLALGDEDDERGQQRGAGEHGQLPCRSRLLPRARGASTVEACGCSTGPDRDEGVFDRVKFARNTTCRLRRSASSQLSGTSNSSATRPYWTP